MIEGKYKLGNSHKLADHYLIEGKYKLGNSHKLADHYLIEGKYKLGNSQIKLLDIRKVKLDN